MALTPLLFPPVRVITQSPGYSSDGPGVSSYVKPSLGARTQRTLLTWLLGLTALWEKHTGVVFPISSSLL